MEGMLMKASPAPPELQWRSTLRRTSWVGAHLPSRRLRASMNPTFLCFKKPIPHISRDPPGGVATNARHRRSVRSTPKEDADQLCRCRSGASPRALRGCHVQIGGILTALQGSHRHLPRFWPPQRQVPPRCCTVTCTAARHPARPLIRCLPDIYIPADVSSSCGTPTARRLAPCATTTGQ